MTLRKFNLIASNWELLREELSSPFSSVEEVHEFLALSSGNASLDLKGLFKGDFPDELEIFNFIRTQSLRIEDIFPSHHYLNILESGTDSFLSFSREQILVLLSHMTLLTLKTTPKHIYWITFENWLTDGRPCAQAYLQGLFSYFSEAKQRVNTGWAAEMVTFERKTLSKENTLFPLPDGINLESVELDLTGRIGDHSRIIIDFANEDIGFGIGGTQEEVLFGSFLEMCPAMIFCETMQENEAIVIKNVVKYASYSGYGFTIRFQESSDKMESYDVIAMDALDFSGNYSEALSLQLKPCNLERELIKLVVGFSFFNGQVIDTGHWGCGAFGGNKCIKSLLQMMAACMTNNTLYFNCFSDQQFYDSCRLFLSSQLPLPAKTIWTILSSIDPLVTADFTFEDMIHQINKLENHNENKR